MVASVAALSIAALLATQLGYTQKLLDAARYRLEMFGVPDLSEVAIAPQPVAYLTTAGWERIPLPAPANQILSFSADPVDSASLVACGWSPPVARDSAWAYADGPMVVWFTHDGGITWSRAQAPEAIGSSCWLTRASDAP
jgi:hypothetical protein